MEACCVELVCAWFQDVAPVVYPNQGQARSAYPQALGSIEKRRAFHDPLRNASSMERIACIEGVLKNIQKVKI